MLANYYFRNIYIDIILVKSFYIKLNRKKSIIEVIVRNLY